jgi:hypothetical protein
MSENDQSGDRDNGDGGGDGAGGEDRRGDGGGGERRKRKRRPSPAQLARRACDELADVLGREVESIVSLRRTDDGWSVGAEVLEVSRIPDTADVMAEYEVDADQRGRLVGYQRVRRYPRGSAQDER